MDLPKKPSVFASQFKKQKYSQGNDNSIINLHYENRSQLLFNSNLFIRLSNPDL